MLLALAMRIAIAAGQLAAELRSLVAVLAMVGLLLGLAGLYTAQDWRRAGRGRRPALIAMVFGLLLWLF